MAPFWFPLYPMVYNTGYSRGRRNRFILCKTSVRRIVRLNPAEAKVMNIKEAPLQGASLMFWISFKFLGGSWDHLLLFSEMQVKRWNNKQVQQCRSEQAA